MIPYATISRLHDYEACPLRAKLKYEHKIPEPVQPDSPAERGSAIHQSIEDYIQKKTDTLSFDALGAEPYATQFRDAPAHQPVLVEQMWTFDELWEPLYSKDSGTPYFKCKLDVYQQISNIEAYIVDWKGFPVNTPIPTPEGFVPIGELTVGSFVYGADGKPYQVKGKSPTNQRQCYRLTFDDKTTTECDDQHLWTLIDGSVVPITQIKVGDRIPLAKPVEYPHQALLIDPYVLGIWLADGKHTSGEITKPDEFIWEEIQRRGYQIGADIKGCNKTCAAHTVYGLRTQLGNLDLLCNKHIPEIYLRASVQQRIDLVRGLMDGDGNANPTRKQAVFTTTDPFFSDQVYTLLMSLGLRVNQATTKQTGFGKTVEAYPLAFRMQHFNPFSLPRKAERMLEEWGPGQSWYREVESIELTDVKETCCIAVDSPDNTFLCGLTYLVTHNSGRKAGNEIKHADQIRSYIFAALARDEELDAVTCLLRYTDAEEETLITTYRMDVMRHFSAFNARIQTMLTDAYCFPRPSINHCRYCSYKKGSLGKKKNAAQGTGHCDLNPE